MVVGAGAREHVIAATLHADGAELYAYMPAMNPGIKNIARACTIGALDHLHKVVDFAKKHHIDFALIGPEAPLALGMADVLEEAGVRCIGPQKAQAQLETSKAFTRRLLQKYGIDASPRFGIFNTDNQNTIGTFLDELGQYVIKPDGLTGGKGVKLSTEHLHSTAEALHYCDTILQHHSHLIVEEKLIGAEFSLQSLTDGRGFLHFPPVQDHKRAHEYERGPNTGGMGSYSDANLLLPFLTIDEYRAAAAITEQVAAALQQEVGTYRGIMYGGFIKTARGIQLLEYNARFGDPEAMNVLPLLKTNFVDICNAVLEGTLSTLNIDFLTQATVCKYVVPEGYPAHPRPGKIVVPQSSALTYYAAIEERADGMYTGNSRGVAFVGIGRNISEAEAIAENAAAQVTGAVFHRRDIGTEQLIRQRAYIPPLD